MPISFVRPYGPNAAWNRPIMVGGVQVLPTDPNSAYLAGEHYNNSPPNGAGNFRLNLGYRKGSTFPIYDARDAQGTFPVVAIQEFWGNLHGRTAPFSTEFIPHDGPDGQVIVINPDTGEEWNYWRVTTFDGVTINCTSGQYLQTTEGESDWGSPGNYFTKENGTRGARECGIQLMAMLIRPEEITQGKIEHALSVTIGNTDGCVYRAPAIKHGNRAHPCDWVPIGTRFALRVTDAEIEAHLSTLPSDLPAGMINGLRIVAVALRDYGWIATDFTPSGPSVFHFEDWHSADAKWRVLNMERRASAVDGKQYPEDGLKGLITEARMYTVVPSDQYPEPIPVDPDIAALQLRMDAVEANVATLEAGISALGASVAVLEANVGADIPKAIELTLADDRVLTYMRSV